MEFEWDEDKSLRCLKERGFDFLYAAQVFFDPERLIEEDTRFEYGERRFRVIGCIDGRLFVVIYTPRGQIIRIISARKANRREIRRYGKDCSHSYSTGTAGGSD